MNVGIYILFVVLVSLSMGTTAVSCVLCKRWHEAYLKLKKRYNYERAENIRLQHEIYRYTYISPETYKKKGNNENEKK